MIYILYIYRVTYYYIQYIFSYSCFILFNVFILILIIININ
jgi:hypothetical protein